MKRIALEIFRENALRFVARVKRTGESVIITRDGDEVARLVPANQRLWRRIRAFLWLASRAKRNEPRRTSWGVYLKMR